MTHPAGAGLTHPAGAGLTHPAGADLQIRAAGIVELTALVPTVSSGLTLFGSRSVPSYGGHGKVPKKNKAVS